MKEKKLTKLHYICFGFFFVALFTFLTIGGIYGDDYWWHVKAGEWIIQNKQVPRTGIYSWYANQQGLSWFAHEWLAEVVLYGFSYLFGENGGIVYLIFGAMLFGGLLYAFNFKDYIKNLPFTIAWMCMGLLAFLTVFTARPHIITLSLFVILIHVCEKMKQNPTSKRYLWFSVVAIFWANYHGGSSNITYIIPIMYFVTTSFTFSFGRIVSEKLKGNYNYLILATVNLISLLFNPRTYQLLWYPYSYTEEHALYIMEWDSPSLRNGSIAIFVIIFICIIFFVTKENIQFSDLALVGCFMLMTLRSLRFDAWAWAAATMVIFKYIKPLGKQTVLRFISYEFFAFSILILGYAVTSYVSGNSYIEKGISDEAINILKTEDYSRLMNDYNLGSYLVYCGIDTFIDGRADMYAGHNFKQLAEATTFKYDYTWRQFIDEFDFDMFCVLKNTYFTYQLENNKDFKCLYTDDKISIFKRQ